MNMSRTFSLLFGLSLGSNLHLKGDLVPSEAVGLYISIKYCYSFLLHCVFRILNRKKHSHSKLSLSTKENYIFIIIYLTALAFLVAVMSIVSNSYLT